MYFQTVKQLWIVSYINMKGNHNSNMSTEYPVEIVSQINIKGNHNKDKFRNGVAHIIFYINITGNHNRDIDGFFRLGIVTYINIKGNHNKYDVASGNYYSISYISYSKVITVLGWSKNHFYIRKFVYINFFLYICSTIISYRKRVFLIYKMLFFNTLEKNFLHMNY